MTIYATKYTFPNMKQIILLLALIGSVGFGYAQKLQSGSLSALKNETRLNVKIDYSEAILNHLSIDDFVATADNWELAQTELWGKFVTNLNEEMSQRKVRLVGGHFQDAYTMVLRVQEIDGRGNQQAFVDFIAPTGETIAVVSVRGDGGHFGSFYNLAGDGMKDVGERLGQFNRKNGKWYDSIY
jgi:hypothetical protein